MLNQNTKPGWIKEVKDGVPYTELVLFAVNVGGGKSKLNFKTKRRGSRAPSTSL
jgi:hypothetical protein